MKNEIAILIPARYASTRLNAKVLADVKGKPVIQWVWEKAIQSKYATKIIIATDHEEIYKSAKAFGAEVEMTKVDHKCGSDRIMEVVSRHEEFKYILNLQGDEPSITPEAIDLVLKTIIEEDCDISTLVRELKDEKQIQDPNCVKCVFDNNFNALYFSRSPIPYERNKNIAKTYGHIGLYGYTRKSLEKLTSLAQSDIERAESLEQLRALSNGMKIKVSITEINPVGIDTQEDLEKFKKLVG
ncbi:MAG: 3-deoxy-manno-octulosonate cytidylyltransferase [Cyanobacteria bacterium SIG30]|nr:3-deoxy-manno-octulosonate cytidylyltransferase [Cyanobacteria bacterium SIG30]